MTKYIDTEGSVYKRGSNFYGKVMDSFKVSCFSHIWTTYHFASLWEVNDLTPAG